MQILKDKVKQDILLAGTLLFKKNGYNNTSMRDIAKEAGISTGNIYRYFLNKQQIINELLSKVEDEISIFLEKIPSNHKEINHKQLYNLLIEKILECYENNKETMLVLLCCKEQIQYVNFKEKVVTMLIKKIKELSNSVKENTIDDVIFGAISNSIFEGLMYIIIKCNGNVQKMKSDLQIYVDIMLSDVDKKIMEV